MTLTAKICQNCFGELNQVKQDFVIITKDTQSQFCSKECADEFTALQIAEAIVRAAGGYGSMKVEKK